MTDKKLGRNDPCWCASGKKYKRCHLPKESQKPLTPEQVTQALENAFASPKCSAPDQWHALCNGQIVRAHTVQKSVSLSQIARDGRVYGFTRTSNLQPRQDFTAPRLIGLTTASTFVGFCSHHDNEIFREIETRPFVATPEQCFLLDYRALCWELYAKEGLSAFGAFLLENGYCGFPRPAQEKFQKDWQALQIGVQLALQDLSWHKRARDEILLSRQFDPVRAYVIELGHPPPVMCSAAVIPEQDFAGRALERLSAFGVIAANIGISSFHGGRNGAVALTWLEANDSLNIPFVESLASMADQDIPAALLRLFFEMSENVYMAPDWWEQLPSEVQRAVVDRMAWSGNPYNPRKPGALLDDGISFPPWSVLERRCVGFDL